MWYLFIALLFGLHFTVSIRAEKVIPDALIAMQTDRTIDYVLLVEKDKQSLYVYAYDGQFRELKRYRCSTGENIGSKKQSGDRKTPEGIYFFNNRFTKRDLTPIYGTRAFPTDYPNYMDRFAGKNGSAIWVHGTNKKLKDRDTNGCVAMINQDIDDLDKYIDLHHTPIIIQKRIDYVHPNECEPIRVSLIQFLRTLSSLLMYGDAKAYFSHFNYISDYIPKWWHSWENLRQDIKQKYPEATIEFKHPILLKHDRIFVALFDQMILTGTTYRENDLKRIIAHSYSAGKKKLFIVRYNEKWRIVGEEYQTASVQTTNNYPLIAASLNLSEKPGAIATATATATSTITPQIVQNEEVKQNISQMIDNWITAWKSKDIEQYGSFYDKKFHSQGKNKKNWVAYKNRLNKKYSFINITRKDLTIYFYKKYKNRVRVSFEQTYESNLYSAVGRKTLILKYSEGQWRIYREYWKNL